ncbi:SDR family NAD(P)-dependent oxidoreductase [Psychrobacter proteolyticus]|uniref:SDR family NAD(P)-dependent oxidoreductase n=1 Tax=Psychrobacter proteolyticus TaxID=147825 RepID=UPI000E0A7954|nr:SDR family oxidoreductase [Psychrobacter proteolyticus]
MNKIVLITGGSRGLGRSGALELAKQGTDVVITYLHNKQAALEVVAEVEALGQKAVAMQLDSRDFASYPEFVEKLTQKLSKVFGRDHFDYLVNNAGNGLHKPFSETSMEEFDDLYQVHLKAPYFFTQALLGLITDGGHILNVSSGLARFSLPGSSAYAVMKGGVEVLTRYLAKELGERGISVNTIAPGAIATDFNGGSVRDNQQINTFVSSVTAKGRVGEAQDIGAMMAMLLCDKSYWITGQRIEASGGMFL